VPQTIPNAEDALQRLLAGNRRYSTGQLAHPRQTPQRRLEVAAEQHPFAAILGCVDSRAAPEIIFDQGLGDLYVVRVAAHLADSVVLGSLELGVVALGLRLIVVLGHDQCAAFSVALELLGLGAGTAAPRPPAGQPGAKPPVGHLRYLTDPLQPAVTAAQARAGNLLDNAIDANISRVVEQLEVSSPILAEHVEAQGLKIVGARYSLTTGEVTFMS